MRKNETVSAHTSDAQQKKMPGSEEGRQQNKDTAYRAPRLVALGSAVELVQGNRYGNRLDGLAGLYYG